MVMSRARNPVPSATKRTDDEIASVLREHLDDAEADVMARRYRNAEQDAKTAVDWPTAKRRILDNKTTPKP